MYPLALNFKISSFSPQVVFMGYVWFSYDSDTFVDVTNKLVCNGNIAYEGGIGFLDIM